MTNINQSTTTKRLHKSPIAQDNNINVKCYNINATVVIRAVVLLGFVVGFYLKLIITLDLRLNLMVNNNLLPISIILVIYNCYRLDIDAFVFLFCLSYFMVLVRNNKIAMRIKAIFFRML